ncbi:MAG: response regulator transcription factor [Candidatus Eisenbacteria bacterium]|nr:response regulator transcription factor [Candidatus Eisenbacteria bacterium]
MSVPKHVLVAERDPRTLNQITRALRAAGYATSEAESGREVLRFVQMETPDLVVVGLHLQDIGGKDLARILESNGTHQPVRTIVACDSRVPVEECMAAGGAVEKPVLRWSHIDEFVTRINEVLGLSVEKDASTYTEPVSCGAVRMDPGDLTVEVDGVQVDLSEREFRFLQTLALNGERTCTRDELRRQVWGENADVIGRTVDVLVSRLRSKLLSATGREVISTVRGVGYRFIG